MQRVCRQLHVSVALVLVIAVAGTGTAMTAGPDAGTAAMQQRFRAFMRAFGRRYSSRDEEARRFAVFTANMARARELQLRNPLAKFGETEFADRSPAEFKVRHNAEKAAAVLVEANVTSRRRTKRELSAMPTSVDWRQHGAVTPVKNQGQCGSCWAFSTTGNIEGQWFLAGHNLTSLSEQELVSCDDVSDACNGGFTARTMQWLVQAQDGWITSEADYPYVSGYGSVPSCALPKPHVAKITNYEAVQHDEQEMAAYMASNGPLSICIDASIWQHYQGGLMTDCPAGTVDHCVLIVGYSMEDNAAPFWIVKNSWGVSWGIEGYAHVAYGSNQCDITSSPNSAIVGGSGPPPPNPPPAPTVRGVEYACPDATCNDGCESMAFDQGVCFRNPSGVAVMVICHAETWTIYKWDSTVACRGEYETIAQPLNTCFRDAEGYYLYNECPVQQQHQRQAGKRRTAANRNSNAPPAPPRDIVVKLTTNQPPLMQRRLRNIIVRFAAKKQNYGTVAPKSMSLPHGVSPEGPPENIRVRR